MVDAEPVREQLVLRRDRVVVVVLRKACAQSVAGLADSRRAAARTEQHTGKLGLRN